MEEAKLSRQAESRKFITDVVWVGLGQLFMSMTGLVVLPALTKNYPTEIYGIWSQIVVTIGFLRIMTIKFESAMIRFLAAEDNKDKRRQALSAMLWPIIALIGVVVFTSTLLRYDLSVFLFTDTGFVNYVPLVFVWGSLEALFLFSLSYQRARGKNKTFSSIRLASAIVRMLTVVFLALAGYNFFWLIFWVVAFQTLFVIVNFIMIFLDVGLLSFNFTGVKKYLVYSLPLLPGEILYWVINASDRYFISHLLNVSQTGIYSAAFSLANLLMLLSWPIGVVLFPSVSRLWEKMDREKVKGYFEYSMKFFIAVAIPAAVGLSALSQPLLGILATSEFQVGWVLVLLLAISVTLAGVFLINEYTIYLVKKTTWLALINAIGAIINIVLNITLVPLLGIMGAAVSTLTSYLIITVIIIIFGRKHINYNMDFLFLFKVIGASVIMGTGLWFLDIENVVGIVLSIILGTAVYGVILYLFKAFSKEDRRIIKNAFSGIGVKTKSD